MGIFVKATDGPIRRIIIFIDGEYLRKWLEKKGKTREEFGFKDFSNHLVHNCFDTLKPGLTTPILIRTYYYDAIPDPSYKEGYEKQTEFHKYLNRNFSNYEVRTGNLAKRGKYYVQKGVDAILAHDMIVKAFLDQYDIAIIVAGDQDHFTAVHSVKNRGKNVYGVYHADSYSRDLVNEFDIGYELEDNESNFKVTEKKEFKHKNVKIKMEEDIVEE